MQPDRRRPWAPVIKERHRPILRIRPILGIGHIEDASVGLILLIANQQIPCRRRIVNRLPTRRPVMLRHRIRLRRNRNRLLFMRRRLGIATLPSLRSLRQSGHRQRPCQCRRHAHSWYARYQTKPNSSGHICRHVHYTLHKFRGLKHSAAFCECDYHTLQTPCKQSLFYTRLFLLLLRLSSAAFNRTHPQPPQRTPLVYPPRPIPTPFRPEPNSPAHPWASSPYPDETASCTPPPDNPLPSTPPTHPLEI